ncbi:hypothetical protein PLEOSDRAFT_1078941 [Pleurotus ostreatus PC15]|uniref:Uncharacterized protein n=1 Tax=Pleurotus ostreatus (strain PC15) TaxID=1137138 RepID=A0A067NDK3_PLEO1|nr:hypothetical protein PLEOSDRAFT_1078941 [Pleurotus ostreatus PC15]
MCPPQGLWLGAVPAELQDLRFVEKLVIARVRYSNCFVRVSSGFRKMIANALAFESPVPKVYTRLPISKAELDEVLVILFTGPRRPEKDDLKRTPFLVRANKVRAALEWLILNHADYAQIVVDEENLDQYRDDIAPVTIQYKSTTSAKVSGTPAVNDMEEEDGTEEGPCPFVIHGLTGAQMEEMSSNALKTLALQYFSQSGRVLAIGQSSDFESIWNNPQLYPSMFPWLFPYGFGGVGSVYRMSTAAHKKWLLMYHDKRFQTDATFPFVAFSHEQIMKTSTNAFLLTEKSKFKAISDRIMSLNEDVLASIATRTANGEHVKPETADEKNCFDIKHQRNEIWSLMYHVGSPIWYITLSPVDIKHPISIYYADLFIQEILRFDADGPGIYGNVEAYYGTVEQQGRLSLHLHAMLWIMGSMSPQEIRNNLLAPDGIWRERILQWLEGCYMGEFLTGSQEDVENHVIKAKADGTYSNVHNCDRYLNKDGTQNKLHVYKGCKDNKWGKCKAWFPRKIVKETEVNETTGSIVMKKLEQWINTYTPIISYIVRSNTDVTSMLSGTAVKAVVAYARQIMTKVVNLMGAKLEMGSPMICMYLLGHQDHYTSHIFKVFYWTSYVSEARSYWHPDDAYKSTDKVALVKMNNRITGLSPVFDYVYRPDTLESMCLYDWAIRCKRVKPTKSKSKTASISDCNNDDDEDHKLDNDDFEADNEDTDQLLAPPRRDQGDREYYCSVMLALFLPWRSGKELKDKDQTWDEAFVSHNFSAQHVQVMNNFNLRYECLDAKDDFRTEMKTGADNGILQNTDDVDLQLEIDKMCASALRRNKAIKSMKALMQNSNWATPLLNKKASYAKLPRKSPREWRQLILSLRQQVTEARKQSSMETSNLGTLEPSQLKDYNYVKVVDKSYLEAAYVSSIHRELFCLNTEQNRAFTIVANHSVAENSGQLKMYIGGMGGTGKSQVLKALVHLFTSRNELHRLLVVAPTANAACTPFGGLNMIFAGDFAQLPPPIGGESVSLYSHSIGYSLKKLRQQEEAFGKVLWHQVTTVVILRQNMRQKSQTKEDAKFRTALENMRYRACTLEDVQFLRGRVLANIEGRASVCDAKFRDVSIITARHVNKDAINVLGEQRFAAEHNLSLTTFYYFDEVKGKKRATKVKLDEQIQRVLWEQPACSVEKKIPAKLNLCKGLPVMLRDNSATELCMTNGQEGTVFDWVAATGVYGQLVLDVLFVKLKSPPKDVQFEGLPLNVVPVLRTIVPTWILYGTVEKRNCCWHTDFARFQSICYLR